MSYDHEIVVRGRRRSVKAIRALAATAIGSLGTLQASEVEEEADDATLELRVELAGDGGGTLDVERLPKGYRLTIDSSRDGNRDFFESLVELAERIGEALGKIVDGETAAAMIEEALVDEDVVPLGSAVLFSLEDRDGKIVGEERVGLHAFGTMVDAGGGLRERFAPAAVCERRRFEVRARTLRAVLHDEKGNAFRRYTWELDGYGRIIHVDVSET